MQNRIVVIVAAAVVVIIAAFVGGYFLQKPNTTTAQTPVQTQPVAPTSSEMGQAPAASQQAAQTASPELAPDNTADSTAQLPVAASPAPAPVETPPPSTPAKNSTPPAPPPPAPPPIYVQAPPSPPPPPPPTKAYSGPNPFTGRFATFPAQRSGSGTLASPLTWLAQTELSNGHLAALRLSVSVPEPPAGDRGAFWRRWGNTHGDVMPDATHGTPVVVAGSVSASVDVDAHAVDLNAPAQLLVESRAGARLYTASEAVPVHGNSWRGSGVRWFFVPDAALFNLLRQGADVELKFRARVGGSALAARVPFATAGIAPALRSFETSLRGRMPRIAMEWNRARPGNAAPNFRRTVPPNTSAAGAVALVRAFAPPTDSCGAEPSFMESDPKAYARLPKAQLAKARADAAQVKRWLDCRQQWLTRYHKALNGLSKKTNASGTALARVPGGAKLSQDYATASKAFTAEQAAWRAHTNKIAAAGKNVPSAAPAQAPNRSPAASPRELGKRSPHHGHRPQNP